MDLETGLLFLPAFVWVGAPMTRARSELLVPLSVPEFGDDFEQERTILDLFPADVSRWTGYEFVPLGTGNRIEPTSDTAGVPSAASSGRGWRFN